MELVSEGRNLHELTFCLSQKAFHPCSSPFSGSVALQSHEPKDAQHEQVIDYILCVDRDLK